MSQKYINQIKSIVISSNFNEIKKVLNDIKTTLTSPNYDKDFPQKIISQLKREINKYRRNFKKNYPDINNLYLYPENQPFLYFCSIITEFKNAAKDEFNLLEAINTCIEILENLNLTRTKHLSFNEQIEILLLVNKKFNLFSLLNYTNRTFHLYNFPCLFNEDSCDIMAREYQKKPLSIWYYLIKKQKIEITNISIQLF